MNLLLLGATTQQRIGVAFAIILVAGWAGFLLYSLRRSGEAPGDEMVTAPNRRPYFDDQSLEGPRLERAQIWAVITLFITVLGLFLYWVDEPSRQAAVGFDKRAAARGFVLFQPSESDIPEGNVGHFGCGRCHGSVGQGGVTPFAITDDLGRSREVRWVAPSLDDVLLRFDEDEVSQIITYGRANTPMPPWGVEGGGPMNSQQVTDLIAYIKSIQLKPAEARARWEKRAAESSPPLDPNDGATLFDNFCSRCHTKGWSFGEPEQPGGGAMGPNLTGRSTIGQFPDITKHLELVTEGSQFKKPYGTRGEGSGRMPGFGLMLTEAQIRAIVEYERSL